MQLLLRAVDPLRQIGHDFESARVKIYLGLTIGLTGRYREGILAIDEVEAQAVAAKQLHLTSIARLLRSLLHRGAMNWPAMLKDVAGMGANAAHQGEKVYAILGWSVEAWGLNHVGRYAEAAELRRKAVAIAQEMGGKHIISDWLLASDAEAALLRGEPDLALTIAQALAQSSSLLNLPKSWGIAERILAVAHGRLGGPLDAVEAHFQESLRVLAVEELLLDIAQTELSWGLFLRERGDQAGARRHIEKALRIFESAGCDQALLQIRQELPS